MFETLKRIRFGLGAASDREDAAPHPTDGLLVQELRLLPVPTPGADFDRKVLAALGSGEPRTQQTPKQFAKWALPVVAATSLALTCLIPSTRAVVCAEATSTVLFWQQMHRTGPIYNDTIVFSQHEAMPLPHEREWAAALPPLFWFGDGTRLFPTMPDGSFSPGRDSDSARLLAREIKQWGQSPDFSAALLRHGLASVRFPGRKESINALEINATFQIPMFWDERYRESSAGELVTLAEHGEVAEPLNAFFPVMHAALAFRDGHRADALALVRQLPAKRYWNDHGAEEAIARYQYTKSLTSKSASVAWPILQLKTFPRNAVEVVVLNAAAYAKEQEHAGNTQDGVAIRLALFGLVSQISDQARTPADANECNSLLIAAMAMPGGKRLNHVRSMTTAHGTVMRVEFWSSDDEKPQKQIERFSGFLTAQGKADAARWARQVFTQTQAKNDTLRQAEVDAPASTRRRWLRTGWALVTPLALLSVALGVLALVFAAVRVMPGLKRREELPTWFPLGLTIGMLGETLINTFDGVYQINGIANVTRYPVLVALVLGIGYLRLRRPVLILKTGIASGIGALLANTCIQVGSTFTLRAASIVLEQTPYSVLHQGSAMQVPIGVWMPMVLACFVGWTAFFLHRGQGATWQVTYRKASRQTGRAALVVVCVFSLWCINVAWQEAAFDHLIIAELTKTTSKSGGV